MKEMSKETVFLVASKILWSLSSTLETGRTKAILAKLRNSVGAPISSTVDIWQEVFAYMPEQFLSVDGNPTDEEKAIFTALQLYAIHQQGNSTSVLLAQEYRGKQEAKYGEALEEKIDQKWKNIGYSLKCLRSSEPDNNESMDRRFNAMITSSTFYEMTQHLRHLIRILKARSSSKINYARLANDLYWFQKGRKEQIRLQWGQSYYSFENTNKKEQNNENK